MHVQMGKKRENKGKKLSSYSHLEKRNILGLVESEVTITKNTHTKKKQITTIKNDGRLIMLNVGRAFRSFSWPGERMILSTFGVRM